MNSTNLSKFKVYLDIEKTIRGVLLPTDINYLSLVTYIKNKFKYIIEDKSISLHYLSGSNNICVNDDADVAFFVNEICCKQNMMQTLFIKLIEQTSELLIMSTRADRGWMYDVKDTDRFLSYTFCSNLDAFLEFAFSNKAFVMYNCIRCPCLECNNKHYITRNDVMFHLFEKGFTPNYTTWSAHGETSSRIQHEGEYTGPVEDDKRACMVVDEVVPSNVDNTTYESNYDSNILEGTKGCQKNLKVKVTSELFKSKSKATRRCQKNLEVNLTSELLNLKWKNKKERKVIMNGPPVSTTDSRLSIFKYPSQRLNNNLREYKYTGDAMTIAHRCILLNCEEVRPFVRLFDDLTRQRRPNIDENGLDIYRDQHFAAWFQNYVFQESNDISQDLKDLAQGPLNGSWTYGGYLVNGYEFYTQKHCKGKVAKSSGVCVRGRMYNEHEHDYYGILDDIIEVEYESKIHGKGSCVVVLFNCKCFDTPGGVGVKRKDNLVHIDSKVKLLKDSLLVPASKMEQVYYGPYPRMSKELRDWWADIKSQDEVKMKSLTECISDKCLITN